MHVLFEKSLLKFDGCIWFWRSDKVHFLRRSMKFPFYFLIILSTIQDSYTLKTPKQCEICKKETLFKKSELSSFAPVSGPKCFWEEIVSARHIRCFCKAWSYTTDSMQMSVSLSVLRQPLFTIFTFASQTQGRRVLSTLIAHGVEKQNGR